MIDLYRILTRTAIALNLNPTRTSQDARREIIRYSIPLPSSSTSIWRRRAEVRVVELLPFAVEFLVGETVLAVERILRRSKHEVVPENMDGGESDDNDDDEKDRDEDGDDQEDDGGKDLSGEENDGKGDEDDDDPEANYGGGSEEEDYEDDDGDEDQEEEGEEEDEEDENDEEDKELPQPATKKRK